MVLVLDHLLKIKYYLYFIFVFFLLYCFLYPWRNQMINHTCREIYSPEKYHFSQDKNLHLARNVFRIWISGCINHFKIIEFLVQYCNVWFDIYFIEELIKNILNRILSWRKKWLWFFDVWVATWVPNWFIITEDIRTKPLV